MSVGMPPCPAVDADGKDKALLPQLTDNPSNLAVGQGGKDLPEV